MERVIVDGHCDTLVKLLEESSGLQDTNHAFHLQDAKQMKPYIQCLAAFVHPKYSDRFLRANQLIDVFKKETQHLLDEVIVVKDKTDIEKVIQKKEIGVILTIENGSAIGGNLENINKFKQDGVKIMSLTWNQDNELGTCCHTTQNEGLSWMGKQYVKELERRNILVDVSHSSKRTFFDIVNIAQNPIIATHSCVESICNHKRNLSDEQIKLIAQSGRNNRNMFLFSIFKRTR